MTALAPNPSPRSLVREIWLLHELALKLAAEGRTQEATEALVKKHELQERFAEGEW